MKTVYNIGDKVSVLNIIGSSIYTVIGEIKRVIRTKEYDCLIISGKTWNGGKVCIRTYSDNKSIRLLNSEQGAQVSDTTKTS